MRADLIEVLLTLPFVAVGGIIIAKMIGLRGIGPVALLAAILFVTTFVAEAILPGRGGSPFTSKPGGGLLAWFCWCLGAGITRRLQMKKTHG